jgi:predicted anti-sigma-YlaC factor YlaD
MAGRPLVLPGSECDRARERVSLELDGTLDDVGRGLLSRHLARCADCSTFAFELGALTTLLRAAPLEPHVCEIELRSGRMARRVPWAGSAAVVAALALGITSLPYASSPSAHDASLAAADLGRSLGPVKLPIGQRSAEDDFVAPPVVLEA